VSCEPRPSFRWCSTVAQPSPSACGDRCRRRWRPPGRPRVVQGRPCGEFICGFTLARRAQGQPLCPPGAEAADEVGGAAEAELALSRAAVSCASCAASAHTPIAFTRAASVARRFQRCPARGDEPDPHAGDPEPVRTEVATPGPAPTCQWLAEHAAAVVARRQRGRELIPKRAAPAPAAEHRRDHDDNDDGNDGSPTDDQSLHRVTSYSQW
jgi:hypothetical protein